VVETNVQFTMRHMIQLDLEEYGYPVDRCSQDTKREEQSCKWSKQNDWRIESTACIS
jgi:hypothetical protein